jgi:hypothetical protein
VKQIWVTQGRVLDGDWHDLVRARSRKEIEAQFQLCTRRKVYERCRIPIHYCEEINGI